MAARLCKVAPQIEGDSIQKRITGAHFRSGLGRSGSLPHGVRMGLCAENLMSGIKKEKFTDSSQAGDGHQVELQPRWSDRHPNCRTAQASIWWVRGIISQTEEPGGQTNASGRPRKRCSAISSGGASTPQKQIRGIAFTYPQQTDACGTLAAMPR